MPRSDLRSLVRFVRIGELAVDAVGLLAIALLFLSYLSPWVLNTQPATGGDTGSHFWPLVTLVKHSLPNLGVRVWNPGNLGGEPHLVHYFPFPYFIMAAISLFAPLGLAFNLGTISSLFFLPFCAYFAVRLSGFRFPAPLLAAALSLLALYNESYSMWGGNTLSTLAGQFAHVWALDFLLLGIGCIAWEHKRKLSPCFSSLAFASVAMSHAYVLLGIPFSAAAFVMFHHEGSIKSRVVFVVKCGVLTVLLSVWFLVPLVENAPWTTAFILYWSRENLLSEVFPPILYPVPFAIVVAIVALAACAGRRAVRRRALYGFMMWLVPSLGYGLYYFVFPALGLVDVRAFPQIQLFLCLLAGTLAGMALSSLRVAGLFGTPIVVAASLCWADAHVKQFPRWVEWNYSGWEEKAAYKDLSMLYEAIRGDFSMPRVVFEHNDLNGSAGSTRVFEMLPYFAGRATLESVYLQASILGPMAFLIQAEVSKTPTCPFIQYECKPYDLESAWHRLKLAGVSELILVTEPLLEMARNSPRWREEGRYGYWTLFRTVEPATLVEVFRMKPRLVSDDLWKGRYTRPPVLHSDETRRSEVERLPVDMTNWKDAFYYWLFHYTGSEPMMITERNLEEARLAAIKSDVFDPVWESAEDCQPSVEVAFDRIKLKTPCKGRAHYLKFAYHSAWQADSGDPLYLVSPGYIALIPTRNEVTLRFGPVPRWQAAGAVSIVTLVLLLAGTAWRTFGSRSSRSRR